MSKAEERANEKYPLMSEDDKEGLESLKYIGIECDSVYEFNSIRYYQQCYFIEGYQQAEKDLELTWEDMFNIFRLVNEVFDDYADGKTKKEIGEEILRRFNERKKK